MTKSSSVSGDITPGEIFTYTIVVENDANALADATNVTVRDPLPEGVTYFPESTIVVGPVFVNVQATDDFGSDDFSGGSGWADPSWTQDGTTAVVDKEAELYNNGYIYRSVDLSAVSSATVSFDVRESGRIDRDDRARVGICTDDSFADCQILFDKTDDFDEESVSVSIDNDKLTATAIMIAIVDNYQRSEYFYIDNIVIQGQSLSIV